MRYFSRFKPRRPSAALIVAVIALVAALAGNAQALPGVNTIFSDDIVNGEVKALDIDTDAVRAPDIRANAVGSSELAANAAGSSEVASNAVGTSELAANSVKASDLGNVALRQNSITLNPGQANFVIASCNAGEVVLTGSASISPINDPDVALTASIRQSNTTWEAGGVNKDTVAHDLIATAVCLTP